MCREKQNNVYTLKKCFDPILFQWRLSSLKYPTLILLPLCFIYTTPWLVSMNINSSVGLQVYCCLGKNSSTNFGHVDSVLLFSYLCNSVGRHISINLTDLENNFRCGKVLPVAAVYRQEVPACPWPDNWSWVWSSHDHHW